MLAGHMRSPLLWLLSRLSSFPSPPTHHPVRPDNSLRFLARSICRRHSIFLPHAPLPEWKVSQWAPRWSRFSSEWAFPAAIRLAQCAFNARRAVEAFDLNSAFSKERQQDTFKGIHKRTPRMLPFYV